jgi:ferric-dicitrate binding protein FerR (iron transport regulator)
MRYLLFPLLALVSLQGLPSRAEAVPLDGIIKAMTGREQAMQRRVAQCNSLLSGVQQSLRQSEEALRQAQVSKDRVAEATAREAVALSRDNYNGYRELCAERTLDLQRARKSLALAQRLQQLAGTEPVNAAVVEQRGQVERSAAAGPWGALAGDSAAPLRSGDRLRTGPNSGAEFLLQDGATAAQIGANTEMQLTLDDAGNAAVDLTRGAFYAAVAPLMSRVKRMEVRTGGGSGAVRGTRFAVHQAADRTEFMVLEGQVEVTPVAGGDAVLVHAGQRLVLRPDEPGAAATDIDWSVTRRWWREEMAE